MVSLILNSISTQKTKDSKGHFNQLSRYMKISLFLYQSHLKCVLCLLYLGILDYLCAAAS